MLSDMLIGRQEGELCLEPETFGLHGRKLSTPQAYVTGKGAEIINSRCRRRGGKVIL